jgi:hypothetical protein
LDDILVLSGDEAFIVSQPYSGSTSLRNGSVVQTGAAYTRSASLRSATSNGDGLLDIAWPATTLNDGSPDGSAVVARFATVCPGNTPGTICDGHAAFDIILDPLSSAPLEFSTAKIVWGAALAVRLEH